MDYYIFNIRLNLFNSHNEVYCEILKRIEDNKNTVYITVNNSHTIVYAKRCKEFSKILNKSFLSLTDGQPLVVAGRILDNTRYQRIFGPSLMEYMLKKGAEDKLKHFIFGGSTEVLEQCKQNIQNLYPGTKIAGMISPPYTDGGFLKNDNYIQIINDSNADIIWVALGAPKQEKWMYDNYKKLNKGVLIGIGAGIDYVAGNIKHAPKWMKKMALEWLYRLMQEPGRLWKRYFIYNSLFIYYLILEILKKKIFNKFKPEIYSNIT